MGEAGVVAVLLPGAQLYLKDKSPPVPLLREHRVTMAIGTDFNPGSSPVCSLWTAASLACILQGCTVPEAFLGITRNAGLALGRPELGWLGPGSALDLAILAPPPGLPPRIESLVQYMGVQLVDTVMVNGTVVITNAHSHSEATSSSTSAPTTVPDKSLARTSYLQLTQFTEPGSKGFLLRLNKERAHHKVSNSVCKRCILCCAHCEKSVPHTNRIGKQTVFRCTTCDVSLCKYCFVKFHSEKALELPRCVLSRRTMAVRKFTEPGSEGYALRFECPEEHQRISSKSNKRCILCCAHCEKGAPHSSRVGKQTVYSCKKCNVVLCKYCFDVFHSAKTLRLPACE
jgi:hypothetical protein